MRIVLAPVSLMIVFVCTLGVISQASGSAESEIQSVMAEARNTSLEGDSAKIAALMIDDYLQTDISGHVQDKATWFKEYFNPIAELIKAGKFRWVVYERKDVQIRQLITLLGGSDQKTQAGTSTVV